MFVSVSILRQTKGRTVLQEQRADVKPEHIRLEIR